MEVWHHFTLQSALIYVNAFLKCHIFNPLLSYTHTKSGTFSCVVVVEYFTMTEWAKLLESLLSRAESSWLGSEISQAFLSSQRFDHPLQPLSLASFCLCYNIIWVFSSFEFWERILNNLVVPQQQRTKNELFEVHL